MVDVQVKEGESGSRRNTIDLQFRENRSRKNTLELKVNGEVVQTSCSSDNIKKSCSENSMPGTPRQPRTLSVHKKSDCNSTTTENQRSNTQTQASNRWNDHMNPQRQYKTLKIFFVLLCIVDIIHWAYLLRDDTPKNPNSWRFYKKFEGFDLYYLVARMFGDIFTCVLGLGAAMWTRKPLLTLPCTTIQLLFLFIRGIIWGARAYNENLQVVKPSNEDKVFIVCEFVLPSIWALLSVLIVRTTRELRSFEQLHGYAHPPIIVLTVKNDDNDESVQIEIA